MSEREAAARINSAIEQDGEAVTGWLTGEREAALRWLTNLNAKLGSKPDHADDNLWITRLIAVLSATGEAVARNDGLEAAAVWHETQAATHDGLANYSTAQVHRHYAKAIRALKVNPATPEEK